MQSKIIFKVSKRKVNRIQRLFQCSLLIDLPLVSMPCAKIATEKVYFLEHQTLFTFFNTKDTTQALLTIYNN